MKRTISILAALLCIIGFRFLPAPSGMTSSAMQVLGIFIGALILWLTLSIDWPSLLALAALVTVPELTMGSVLANSLGNSTVAFLLFTFVPTPSPRPLLSNAAPSSSSAAASPAEVPGAF